MEYSQYNIYLNDYPDKGHTTIYNLFSKKTECYLSDMITGHPDGSVIPSLKRNKFYIESRAEEINAVEEKYENNSTNMKQLFLMLVLTGKCNCKCTYCYEKDKERFPSVFYAKDKVIKFVDDYFRTYDVEDFRLTFYGGEPLLQKDIIDQLTEHFHKSYGKVFRFGIITNGTLLKSEDIAIWEKRGLGILKISIDGDKKSHDNRRVYLNGKGTYDDILDNISEISSGVEIRINSVIDNEVSGFEELICEIRKRNIPATFSINLAEPCDLPIQEKADMLVRYASILKKYNCFQYTKMCGTHGEICQAKLQNDFVIDGNGKIYECNGEFKVAGDLSSDFSAIQKKKYKYKSECRQCKFLPMCYGDCPYYDSCQKDYFEYLLPRILKVYITKKKSDKVS